MTRYIVACGVIFAVSIFLKFVEGSPIRSWKSTVIAAAALSFLVCYYLSCAIPKPVPPRPQSQKLLAYKGELERNFRHIDGVDQASIDGSTVRINFASEKPMAELKRTAMWAGGATASFLREKDDFKITVQISVAGKERYRMVYQAKRGIVEEAEF